MKKIDKQQIDVKLTDTEVKEIRSSESYEKIKNTLFNKAQAKLMRNTYFKNAFWYDFLILCLAALGTTIAFDYFISTTGREGIFPGGMGAITRFLAVATFPDDKHQQASFYFVYYLALNIPLMIFGYFKLGMKFTLSTLLYVGLSIGFDQVIMVIPVINPNEWHMIVDYQLISTIPGAWGQAIWLFVFALFGGIVLGWSYAITYKVGSSSGGTDFITVWFAKKKNKDIGTVNRNVNYVILFCVVIANTCLLKSENFNPEIKYAAFAGIDEGKWQAGYTMYDNLSSWWSTAGVTGDFTTLMQTREGQLEVFRAASTGNFDNFTSSMMNLIRFKFIFGPALFASIILVTVQGITINAVYPKNVKRTIMITTTKPTEVEQFLFDSGYRNDVLAEEVLATKHENNDVKKTRLTITITVFNWKTLEKGIMNIDETMNVNILVTKAVRGPFVNELKDERQIEFIKQKLMSDKKAMAKIEKEALYTAYVKEQKQHQN